MKKVKIYTILVVGALSIIQSCDMQEGETIETAYMLPIIQPMEYKFSRNGTNSVDILECGLVQEPLAYLYSSYLRRAGLMTHYDYNRVFDIYETGGDTFPLGAKTKVANSPIFTPYKSDIINDIDKTLNDIAKISGHDKPVPSNHRNREAEQGLSGYVGHNIGDPNVAFVDEKGIVLAELFNGMVLGSIYLDQVLNLHLDDSVINNSELIKDNNNTKLVVGKNYTELEHHWDLAYGYYSYLKTLTQAEGLPLLKDTEQKIYNAFALGRYEIGRYNYDIVQEQVKIIRDELSRALAIRIMEGLTGNVTLVNVDEKQEQGFQFISRAYGLLYAMQFARDKEGQQYFTRETILNFMSELSKDNGFWDKERLLADEETPGSLKNIATAVGKPFGITINQIKK